VNEFSVSEFGTEIHNLLNVASLTKSFCTKLKSMSARAAPNICFIDINWGIQLRQTYRFELRKLVPVELGNENRELEQPCLLSPTSSSVRIVRISVSGHLNLNGGDCSRNGLSPCVKCSSASLGLSAMMVMQAWGPFGMRRCRVRKLDGDASE
jgi:hypothetical protein